MPAAVEASASSFFLIHLQDDHREFDPPLSNLVEPTTATAIIHDETRRSTAYIPREVHLAGATSCNDPRRVVSSNAGRRVRVSLFYYTIFRAVASPRRYISSAWISAGYTFALLRVPFCAALNRGCIMVRTRPSRADRLYGR